MNKKVNSGKKNFSANAFSMAFLNKFLILLNNFPTTAILSTVTLVLLIKYYFGKRRFFLLGSKLPGPKGWPFLGNALEFLDCNGEIMRKLKKYHRNYDLFAIWIGHNLSVFVKSPEDAETYCNSYKLIHRGENLKYFYSSMGKGLLFAGGEEWKKAKKIMESAFPYSILKYFHSIIQNETNVLIQRLEREDGKKIFLAYPYIRDCTLDIITSGAFEMELKAQKNEMETQRKASEVIKKLAMKRVFILWQRSDFLYKFLNDGKRYFQSFDIVNQFIDAEIKKKLKYLKEEPTTQGEENLGQELFWKKLLTNPNLSKEEIRHHYLTTIVAGYETTASTICFILTMLALHPDVQEKTYKELISITDQTELIDYQKLQKLEYLERVINETLRLFPTVPVILRKCTGDVQFGRHLVPAGSDVHLYVRALHRDPTQFQNPTKFNPDNFLPENVSKRHPYAFIPFSMGPRKCIGIKIAMMSMKIIVGRIVMKYKIECDYKSLKEIPTFDEITIKMRNGCPIRLLHR